MITMKDSTLILNELSFTNNAVAMQLSALYQSPNKDNLFFAMDLHLMDVQIKDMLHLIPYFDTLVPMLKTFGLKLSGPLNKLKFDLEASKYPNHYTPIKRSERKQFHQNLRKLIADRLKRKVSEKLRQ